MIQIGEATIEDVKRRVGGLLEDYLSTIENVFKRDGKVKISMPVELKNEGNGIVAIKVGFSFVTNKIEDTSSGTVNEQPGLFDVGEPRRIAGDRDFSVICPLEDTEQDPEGCKLCGDRRAMIMVDGENMPFELDEMPAGLADGQMIQMRTCARFADAEHKAWMDGFIERCGAKEEDPAEPQIFRIRDKGTNEYWEGPANTVEEALALAWKDAKNENSMFDIKNVEIKIKTNNGAGGWKKYKPAAEKEAA